MKPERLLLNNKSTIGSILFVLSFPLIFLSRIESVSSNIIFLQVALALISWGFLLRKFYRSSLFQNYIIWLSFLLIFYIINMFMVGNVLPKQIMIGVLITSSISALVFFVNLGKYLSFVPFLFVASIIIFRWITIGDSGAITVNSRNYISFYWLLYVVPIIVTRWKEGKAIPMWIPISSFVVAVLAIGRGGIIMTSFFLLGSLSNIVIKGKHKFMLIILIGFSALLILNYLMELDNIEMFFERFEDKGVSSEARDIGWIEYIASLEDIRNFLLGTPIKQLGYVYSVLDGSLHNSYLTLHSRLGLVSFVYLYFLIVGLIRLYKNHDILLLFFFIGLLVKAYVDADWPAIAVGGDVYIYILFLISMFMRHQNKRNYQIANKTIKFKNTLGI